MLSSPRHSPTASLPRHLLMERVRSWWFPSRSAPYWNNLLRFSVTPNDEGFIRSRRQQSAPSNSASSLDLAIFAFDFTTVQQRARSQPTTPPCGHESDFRGRPPAGSPHDQSERARIHTALQDLRTSLRFPTTTP
jgi:hypothetical protein